MRLTANDRKDIIENIKDEIFTSEEYEEYRKNGKLKYFLGQANNPVIFMMEKKFDEHLDSCCKRFEKINDIQSKEKLKKEIKEYLILEIKHYNWISKDSDTYN